MLTFFWFSQTCSVSLKIQKYVFSGCSVLPNSKEIELGSSNKEAYPSACKNTTVVLVPCWTLKHVPTAISGGMNISEGPGSQPTFLLLIYFWHNEEVILLGACKPGHSESQNSLKLSFTNIWGLCFNFVECEYFLELNSPDILGLCQTNSDDSINPTISQWEFIFL